MGNTEPIVPRHILVMIHPVVRSHSRPTDHTRRSGRSERDHRSRGDGRSRRCVVEVLPSHTEHDDEGDDVRYPRCALVPVDDAVAAERDLSRFVSCCRDSKAWV